MKELEKPFLKKSDKKLLKKTENQCQNAACEQKTTSKKANFCSIFGFLLYVEIITKTIHAAKPLAFSLHFLFQRDQNQYSDLISKIMKMCEQVLKKHSRTSADVQFKKLSLTKQKIRPRTD